VLNLTQGMALLVHLFIHILLLLHLQILTLSVGHSNLLTVALSQFISLHLHNLPNLT